jgi:putative ABC transport system ATP-binding protein
MSEVLVRGEGLSRVYGTGRGAVTALREATFEIVEGQQIALYGPSGSGKSTLLHLIAGLLPPTTGRIEWRGRGPADRRRAGPGSFAFQGLSLLPPLSVTENVALPILLAGGTETAALAEAAAMLERLEIALVGHKLPEELSGGQAQRAGLARALVGRPRLVITDEPIGQLDRATGRRVMDVVLSCVKESKAALIVATHDAVVADPLPMRWTIEDGRLATEVVVRSA